MPLTHRQRVLFATVGIVFALAATEGVSLLAIRLSGALLDEPIRTTRDIFAEQSEGLRRLLAPDSSRMLTLDPLLGWRYRAGHRDSVYSINSEGLRGAREYAHHQPAGVLRVAAFGDSFVYGSKVADSAAWPAQMEHLFPEMEVLNYGVGGYGVDQAYLRFCAEGTALSPQVVIIGFVRDDLRRVVNVYRRFISTRDFPLVKPRFTLDSHGDLVLQPNPAPGPSQYERYLRTPREVVALGADDAWYRSLIYDNPLYDYSATVRLLVNVWLRLHDRYLGGDRLVRHGELNPESTAFAIQIALFERFAAAARAAGARPVIVVFPDQESVVAARHGQRTVVGPLIASLAARRLEYVDLTAAFLNPELAGSVGDWFASGGHYSPAGNRIVAQWLGRELLARMAARHTDGAAAQDAPTPVLVRACPGGTVRQGGVAAAGVGGAR